MITSHRDIYQLEEDPPMVENTAQKRHREGESDSPPETQQKRSRRTIESSDPEEDSDEQEGPQGTSAESNEESSPDEEPASEEEISSDEDYWKSPKPKRGGRKTKPQKSTKMKPKSKPKSKPKLRPNLKRDQKGKQLSAVRVDRSSSEPDSGEENDSQEELDIPDQKSNFQPDIQYNEYWTEGKERRLRKDWSPDDDFIIEKSYADEIALWRKTTNIFKCAPPDLIDADVGVQPGGAITNQETGTKWRKTPNWSQKFCMAMSTIICLPVWKGKPECLRYVLRKALHLRVGAGDEKRRAPPMPSEDNIYLKTMLDRIQEQVMEARIVEEDIWHQLRPIIQKEIGSGMIPEHWKFHEYLKKVVKTGFRVTDNDDSCKLQVCDLDNIQRAWKLYTDTEKLQLSTMEQYRDNFNTLNSNKGFVPLGNTQARQDNFKSWKKEWMLKVRRNDRIRENVRLHEKRRKKACEERQVDDEMQSDGGLGNDNLAPPPVQDRRSLNQNGSPSSPTGRAHQGYLHPEARNSQGTTDAPRNEVSPDTTPFVPETQVPKDTASAEAGAPGTATADSAPADGSLPSLDKSSLQAADVFPDPAPTASANTRREEYNASRAKMSAKLQFQVGKPPAHKTGFLFRDHRRMLNSVITEPFLNAEGDPGKCPVPDLQDIEDFNDALKFGLVEAVAFKPRETFRRRFGT
jgi:hypothetical protein